MFGISYLAEIWFNIKQCILCAHSNSPINWQNIGNQLIVNIFKTPGAIANQNTAYY